MTAEKSFKARAGHGLNGSLRVPGDKSISHRSLMLGSIAHGTTRVRGLLMGEDVLATLGAMRGCGADILFDNGQVTIRGNGPAGLGDPDRPLDLGNSGTGMRLLSGLLAGLGLSATLTGDDSRR